MDCALVYSTLLDTYPSVVVAFFIIYLIYFTYGI